MKKIYWLAPLGVLLAIQLIRPDTTNPPANPAKDIRRVAAPPAAVSEILTTACYDCHSNEVQYPWYSNIAPVSWWVADHVREGREKLNFSTFGDLPAADRAEAMEEAGEVVREGEMPLSSYTWMHPAARLSDEQRRLLADWFGANSGENAGTDSAPAGSNPEEAESGDD